MTSLTHPPSLPEWDNLSVLHRNTLPPRTYFFPYPTAEAALSRDEGKSNSVLLSGKWKFSWSPNPFTVPSIDEGTTSWDTVDVPSHWQLKAGGGYGKGAQYTNINYPWPVNPPHPPYLDNETATYVRTFVIPAHLRGTQSRLRFEGVDAAFHVYVNGREVGYSQGSRNGSEFDVTGYVEEEGGNEVRVRVYQRCDGSYIEDQDQWWLSGIFRDVHLISFPLHTRINDFHISTTFTGSTYTDAVLHVSVLTSADTEVGLTLFSPDGKEMTTVRGESREGVVGFEIPVEWVEKWTAETPTLYTILLSLPSSPTPQYLSHRLGFRVIELLSGVLSANGKPLKFRGVNRHEHHPHFGRAVPYDFMRADLLLMKKYNINAIRTSHQPNDPRMLGVADELGFWVIAEADLECHGFEVVEDAKLTDEQRRLPEEEKRARYLWKAAGSWTSDNPDWKEAYEDRARQLVARDRNHTSVVIWSLGNEAFDGRNFYAMEKLIRAMDPTRLIHYEGDRSAGPADMFSQMYPSVSSIIDFATKDKEWEKPLVLCEFAHAMGLGPGAVKEYIDAFYAHPRLCGGFVWEWANHGLVKKNEEGEEFYGYGGAFGDADLNDGNFVMDGLINSAHQVGRGLIEYGKAIEPVQVLSGGFDGVKIINRYDFRTLDHLTCGWTLVNDGFRVSGGFVKIPKNVGPGEVAELKIPGLRKEELEGEGESYLGVEFCEREGKEWAPEGGHCVAWGQVGLVGRKKLAPLDGAGLGVGGLEVKEIEGVGRGIEIKAKYVIWKFDLVQGILISFVKSGEELIHTPPILDFYRALTDNDNPSGGVGKEWLSKKMNLVRNSVYSTTWKEKDGLVEVVVKARIAPPVFDWGVKVTWNWTFSASGEVDLKITGKPEGGNLPSTFPRIGLTFSVPKTLDTATWFGRGPGQGYVDMKLSQRFGRWSLPVEELFTDYEYPQENGNRTDVSWVSLGSSSAPNQLKASFGDREGCSFSASHYTVKDLDEAEYPYLLRRKKREEVVVRLDWAHMGLGTGSCGPGTLEEYKLKSEAFEFRVRLS